MSSAQDDTRRFYDLTAEQVADEWYPNDVLLLTIRDFLRHLPPEPRVLDLGCGPGYESMRLASCGAEVLGLDFSEASIRIARERCPGRCRFELMDFRDLDTRFGRFDGVFASGSLIHVPADELPDLMKRVSVVLEEGGHLLAIVQDGQGTRELRHVVRGQALGRIIHLHRRQDLAAATAALVYRQELAIAEELRRQGWRAHLLAARPESRNDG